MLSMITLVKNSFHGGADVYSKSRAPSGLEEGKPCRACNDFKSWFKNQSEEVHKKRECPLTKSELGRSTWGFLHTMAAYYPEKPTADEQKDMSDFFRIFSRLYPCSTCARDFNRLVTKEPPRTQSQSELKHWLCWAHNQVNKKLGKPRFDCSTLDERWKTGWKDGSCDVYQK